MSSAIVQILESGHRRGVRRHGAIWRIDGLSSQIETLKADLLEEICRDARPFVHYEESPSETTGLEGTVEAAPGIWRLPSRAPGAILLKWLYLGNWQLYVRTAPLPELPDLCRSKDSEVEAFLFKSGVTVVVDSFHDDVSWVVGVSHDA